MHGQRGLRFGRRPRISTCGPAERAGVARHPPTSRNVQPGGGPGEDANPSRAICGSGTAPTAFWTNVIAAQMDSCCVDGETGEAVPASADNLQRCTHNPATGPLSPARLRVTTERIASCPTNLHIHPPRHANGHGCTSRPRSWSDSVTRIRCARCGTRVGSATSSRRIIASPSRHRGPGRVPAPAASCADSGACRQSTARSRSPSAGTWSAPRGAAAPGTFHR